MKYFLVVLLFIIPLIYLNRSYAYFYDFQGDHFIGNPAYSPTHTFITGEGLETKKLVVLGDSLMAGTGSTQEQNSLAYLIAQDLAKGQNVELHNFSYPGVGVEDVLLRQIPEVVKINPDYVVLMIGTNDVHNKMATSEFSDSYSKVISEIQNNTKARVSVVNIPYLGSSKILLPPWNGLLEWRIGLFNNIITGITGEFGIPVIDLHNKFIGEFKNPSDLYAGDGFHPSDKGYKLWAEYLNENLNR